MCKVNNQQLMIEKVEIEEIILNDLKKVISTEIVYQYANYDVSLNDILLKQTLRFSDPITFNDPFDCNEKLLQINSSDILIEETILNLSIKPSRQEKRELKRKFKDPRNQSEILKNKRKEYKLSCFSENYNEILMWSHYAEKHSGICVGFNFPHHYKDKFILCPVKYIHELKPLEGTIDVHRVILYWLTTKSICWKHEEEIRAIAKCKNKHEKHEIINFDSSYIKEIIFGCNVTNEKIAQALICLKKSNLNLEGITIKRMRINENDFLLKEEVIKRES